jgi:hypothetical protein
MVSLFHRQSYEKKHRMGFPNQKRCNVIVYVTDIFFPLCLGKYFSLPREKLWCEKILCTL